jgi:hypothetical protein
MPTASNIQAELEKSTADKVQLTQTFQSLPSCIQADVVDKVCLQADRFVVSMEGADPTKGSDSSDTDWAYMGTILGYVVGSLLFILLILPAIIGLAVGQYNKVTDKYYIPYTPTWNIPVKMYNYGVRKGQGRYNYPANTNINTLTSE